MKTSYFIFLIIVIGCYPSANYGQVKPLKIGDQVPDVILSQISKATVSTTKLSDYKGKLLILDFWATWCSPCVSMLYKTDSLQKAFDGKAQFLPVTYQDKKTVGDFLNKLNTVRHLKLTSVIADSVLNNLFEHSSIPFYAWVDSQGELIATTEANQITKANIEKVINGDLSTIKSIAGQRPRFIDLNKPLFVTGIPLSYDQNDTITATVEPLERSEILQQSILSRYKAGLPGKLRCDSTHFMVTNTPIINFYRLYYGISFFKTNPFICWSNSRCKVEIADSVLKDKITSDKSGQAYLDWSVNNAYNYELVWAKCTSWPEKFSLLADDLERYFGKPYGIEALVEKRLTPSNILTLQTNTGNLKTEGGKPDEQHDAFSYLQHNLPLSHLISSLESYFWQLSDRPIFNETNYDKNVDIELHCKMSDFDAVNKELKKYGLQFKDGQRLADVLIIRKSVKTP
ncbi:TlpA family protein disulfide reductase [Mucilaginibacter lappiensis]|uniref:Thiol-disulfide isomerase/thioredoxin n=1 Tax=Mucilaginibacter lappiensis TaxID=354630 RepID=A0A841JQ34_9SPHI|nr:TlpA family protein disulfide reductase [Mucilaginibacter lappiensis]MBB6131716.1 thiol-disulfide isomerase/thioredoxin [Mucilaginibacter lappiensis]